MIRKLFFWSAMVVVMGCSSETDSLMTGGTTGQGGSLARFAIVNNTLYTVDPMKLMSFDISVPGKPVKAGETYFDWSVGAETIFPFQGKLFLGTETGMLIYGLDNPDQPSHLGTFSHLRACDPVVTNGEHAFVTLRSGAARCTNSTNQLDVIDVTDVTQPTLIKTYMMSNPKGLGLNGNELYVCDDGLKVFDISDVNNLVQTQHFDIPANDVIVQFDKIIVIADDGLYQYSTVNEGLVPLSSISFVNE